MQIWGRTSRTTSLVGLFNFVRLAGFISLNNRKLERHTPIGRSHPSEIFERGVWLTVV